MVVHEEDQGGTRPEGMADGPLVHEPTGLCHAIGGNVGTVARCGTAHGQPPGTKTVCVSILCPRTVSPNDRGEKPYSEL